MSGLDIVFRIFFFFAGLGLVFWAIYCCALAIEETHTSISKKAQKVTLLLGFICLIMCVSCLPMFAFVI